MADDLSNWQPRPRPERRVLEGRAVRLEPFDAVRHGDGLFEASRAADAHSLRAAGSPRRSVSSASRCQNVFTKPPFRPLGPWPQVPASSSTIRASGSSSCIAHAVHIPV